MTENNYRCSLSEKDLQKAKNELREDPDERLGSVQTLTEWIEREPWITAPTDTCFLLAFLRCAKFSQLAARERLGNFIASIAGSYKTLYGHDPADERSLEILREGPICILPERDKEGRVVVFARNSALDTTGRYFYEEFVKAYMPMLHSLLFFLEASQVNGIVFFTDFGGAKMSLFTWAGLDAFTNTAEYVNKAFPARVKGFEYYHTGPVLEAFIVLFKPLLSEKISSRIHTYPTMVSVYERIGKSVFPAEYLPDDYKGPSAGKVQDIVEQNIQEYLLDPCKRNFLKDLYSGKYTADLTKKPTEIEATASFRKLHVS